MPRALARLLPSSLRGQLLLAVAAALLLAQGISAALLYRAQTERREAALVHGAANLPCHQLGRTRRTSAASM